MDAIVAGQDRLIAIDDLDDDAANRNYRVAFDGTAGAANEARVNAFRAAQNALANNAFADEATKTTYLQDIHKAIAKKRIEQYLADHGGRGAVNPATLAGLRTVAAVGGVGATIAHNGADDNGYQNYAATIDNLAVYNADQINGFVVEVCGKINEQRS